VFLARRLRKPWDGEQMVGILLPPSVPGALVNIAALLMGKVPVNLNYTVSEATLASCVTQCNIKSIVTSRKFLEKVKLKLPLEPLFLEDVAAQPRRAEKLCAILAAWLLPPALLEKSLGCASKPSLDDLATVIFSSGSTGEPKGVMLSHYNVGSNIEQLEQIFGLNSRDGMLEYCRFSTRSVYWPRLDSCCARRSCGVLSQSPGREKHRPTRQPILAHFLIGDTYLPAILHARVLARGLRQLARCDDRRREIAGATRHCL
jgi:acyl-CoA synthetase (AMP-forming)/AMP-acid ligase II